jgi:glucitol operon activator protein
VYLDYFGFVILFGVLWLVQLGFTFIQSRGMTKALVDMKRRHVGRNMGIGVTRAKFNVGRGVIVMVVTDAEGIVQEFQALSGVSVLARFKAKTDYVGKPVKVVMAMIKDKRLLSTFQQAIDKINEERSKNGMQFIEST